MVSIDHPNADKLLPLLTDDERARLAEIQSLIAELATQQIDEGKAYSSFFASIKDKSSISDEDRAVFNKYSFSRHELLSRLTELRNEQREIVSKAEERYVQSFADDPSKILEDLRDTLDRIPADDFFAYQESMQRIFIDQSNGDIKVFPEDEQAIREMSAKTPQNAMNWLHIMAVLPFKALSYYKNDALTAQALNLLERRANSFFAPAKGRKAALEAEESGALADFSGGIATITYEPLRHAFLQLPNGSAYIQALKPGADALSVSTLGVSDATEFFGEINEDLKPDILKMFFQAIIENKVEDIGGGTIRVYWPGLLRHLEANTRGQGRNDSIMQDVAAYERCVGIIDGYIVARVITVLSFDQRTGIAEIQAPYLFNLGRKVSSAINAAPKGQVIYNTLTDTKSVKRDADVQEVVQALNVLITTAGKNSGSAHKKVIDIIAECPIFEKKLKALSAKDTSNFNRKLKTVFDHAAKAIARDFAESHPGITIHFGETEPTSTALTKSIYKRANIYISWTPLDKGSAKKKPQKRSVQTRPN